MPLAKTSFALLLFASASIAIAAPTGSRTEAGQTTSASTARLLGTVTAVSGDTITLKSDAGGVATPIRVQDLAVGDRVLVRATPGSAENTYTAQAVIAMKQGDIAQKQQQDREDWQKHSVG